jgi:hypothetical protein
VKLLLRQIAITKAAMETIVFREIDRVLTNYHGFSSPLSARAFPRDVPEHTLRSASSSTTAVSRSRRTSLAAVLGASSRD